MMVYADIDFRNLKFDELSNAELRAVQTALLANLGKLGMRSTRFPDVEYIIKHLQSYVILNDRATKEILSFDQKMALAIKNLPVVIETDPLKYDAVDARVIEVQNALKGIDYSKMKIIELEQFVKNHHSKLLIKDKNWQFSVEATLWAVSRSNFSNAWQGFLKILYTAKNLVEKNGNSEINIKAYHSLVAVNLIELYLYLAKHEKFYLKGDELNHIHTLCYVHIQNSLQGIKNILAKHDIHAQARRLRHLFFTACLQPPLLYRSVYIPERSIRKANSCKF